MIEDALVAIQQTSRPLMFQSTMSTTETQTIYKLLVDKHCLLPFMIMNPIVSGRTGSTGILSVGLTEGQPAALLLSFQWQCRFGLLHALAYHDIYYRGGNHGDAL